LFEEHDLPATLLDEQVEITVGVDVHQLRPGHVQAAEKRVGETFAGFGANVEVINHSLVTRGGGLGRP